MSTPVEPQSGRLNGWKEIALHVGKGTRTVQRWEKLYGLPVHRIGREGGEIVFALRDEIDRWMAGQEAGDGVAPLPAGARGRGRAWRGAVAGVLLALGVVALGVWAALRRPHAAGEPPRETSRQPAAWRLASESLIVFDERGAVLFEHSFGFPLTRTASSDTVDSRPGSPLVLIADVDGDGRSEVLAWPPTRDRANLRLYCLEADGRTRFIHQPTGTRRFGNDDYSDPWLAHKALVTGRPGGPRRVWSIFTHGLMFPSVLQELDPRSGAVRQEYWSNGFMEFVAETSWNGRPVVLVGGTDNDFRAASLAVFPPDGVTGATPAIQPAYTCRDCPDGGPQALYLFPTLCAVRPKGQAYVEEAWVERGDHIRVTVIQGGEATATYYTLGPDGSLLSAEISREFQARHALLERQGVLDHPFGPRDDREMFPVRRWDGRRFVELPTVPVAH